MEVLDMERKTDSTNTDEVARHVTLGKIRKTLDVISGEVSADRINAIQEAYWSIASRTMVNISHVVAGDNFFKLASYIIEAFCAKSYEGTTHNLKDVEAQILRKRNELRQFEAEYRKALAQTDYNDYHSTAW